jgi:hypothetical protein
MHSGRGHDRVRIPLPLSLLPPPALAAHPVPAVPGGPVAVVVAAKARAFREWQRPRPPGVIAVGDVFAAGYLPLLPRLPRHLRHPRQEHSPGGDAVHGGGVWRGPTETLDADFQCRPESPRPVPPQGVPRPAGPRCCVARTLRGCGVLQQQPPEPQEPPLRDPHELASAAAVPGLPKSVPPTSTRPVLPVRPSPQRAPLLQTPHPVRG